MKTITTLNLKNAALLVALGFGAISINAFADDDSLIKNDQAPLAGEFSKLDTDSDSTLTHSEAAKDKLFTKKHFAKADVDHDGTLDQTEYANYKSIAQKKVCSNMRSYSPTCSKKSPDIILILVLEANLFFNRPTNSGEISMSVILVKPCCKRYSAS